MFVKLFSVGLILRRAAQQSAQEVPGNAQAGVIHVHKMQQHGGVFMVQCQADAVYQRADQRGGVQYKQVFAGGVAGARLLGCPRTEAAFLLVKQVVDDPEPQFGQISTECGAGVVVNVITTDTAAAAGFGLNLLCHGTHKRNGIPILWELLLYPFQVKQRGAAVSNGGQVARCEFEQTEIALLFRNIAAESVQHAILAGVDKLGKGVAADADISRGNSAQPAGACSSTTTRCTSGYARSSDSLFSN